MTEYSIGGALKRFCNLKFFTKVGFRDYFSDGYDKAFELLESEIPGKFRVGNNKFSHINPLKPSGINVSHRL
jgi:hypothetical protein